MKVNLIEVKSIQTGRYENKEIIMEKGIKSFIGHYTNLITGSKKKP